MKEDEMLKCLIAFVLGYLVARMMRGNGLSVGGQQYNQGEKNVMNQFRDRSLLKLDTRTHCYFNPFNPIHQLRIIKCRIVSRKKNCKGGIGNVGCERMECWPDKVTGNECLYSKTN